MTYKPEDYPVGATFTRRRQNYDAFMPYYKTRYVVDEGVIADPKRDPSRTPYRGGGLFGSEARPFVYVRWTTLNGRSEKRTDRYGSASASEITVTSKPPTPDEVKAQAEALLEKAGFTLIAIDNVANATKLSFNEGVLRLAGIHGKTVEFRYTKSDTAPVETRRLQVESVESHGDAVLVGGQDPDRSGYRNFRLDRIKGEVSFV